MKPAADRNEARILQWRKGEFTATDDDLAAEAPLEIRANGRTVAVTMRTPGHDAELAAGFLVTEGIVHDPQDIVDAIPRRGEVDCHMADVRLRDGLEVPWERLIRHVFASSSCGICGKASVAAIHGAFPPLDEPGPAVTPETLLTLPARLGDAQPVFERTGGLHAAAVFTADGDLVIAREDVGRHNAVDKVLGRTLLNGHWPLSGCILMVSGRASFEIVQKALAARIPIVAAVSAPSTMAVATAAASRQTLVAFLRDGRFNVYAGAQRIQG